MKFINNKRLVGLIIILLLINYSGLIFNLWYLQVAGIILTLLLAFLLVDLYINAKDQNKFIMDIWLLAIISEIPYDLMTKGNINLTSQNMFFTWGVALLIIKLMEVVSKLKVSKIDKWLFQILFIIMGAGVAYFLNFENHVMGVILLVGYYLVKNKKSLVIIPTGIAIIIAVLANDIIQLFMILGLLFLPFYKEEKLLKHDALIIYFSYPIVLLIFAIIKYLI